MALSQNIQNVKLGPCSVTYDATDLGLTKGGVEVSLTTNKKEVTVDQYGQTIVNDIIMGRTGSVKVPMAETDIEKLMAVIPGSSIVTDHTTSSKKKLVIPTGTGLSLYETAAPLVLHPTGVSPTDKSQDVVIPLTSPSGSLTFAFTVDQERVYQVEFTMYPDSDGLLMVIGDPTASAT